MLRETSQSQKVKVSVFSEMQKLVQNKVMGMKETREGLGRGRERGEHFIPVEEGRVEQTKGWGRGKGGGSPAHSPRCMCEGACACAHPVCTQTALTTWQQQSWEAMTDRSTE